MINFEKRFVHYFWIDTLEGKKGFVADTLEELRVDVQSKNKQRLVTLTHSEHEDFEFTSDNINECYQFCYYDPNFEWKIVYEEGKEIQVWNKFIQEWEDCKCRPLWSDDSAEYRIKPNKDFHVIYDKSVEGFSVDNVETDVDNIFFEGTERDCFEWIKSHKNLEDVIKAYYNDETIQYFEHGLWLDWTLSKTPMVTSWVGGNWRIKPEEEYEVVISFDEQGLAIVELGKDYRKVFFTGTKEECEEWVKDNYNISMVINGYFEDEPIVYKEKGVKNDPWRPTKDIVYEWDFDHYEYRINRVKESKEDEYVPFENTQELIEAWEKKCPANKDRPNGTMPLIWIADKDDANHVSLIIDFDDECVSTSYRVMNFNDLFEKYIFVNGSICGKRK